MNQQKKYILKPGKHQFAPKSPATHNNDNLTDDEAEWYLDKYPHIQDLFIPCSEHLKPSNKSVESLSEIGVITENNNEDLLTTN